MSAPELIGRDAVGGERRTSRDEGAVGSGKSAQGLDLRYGDAETRTALGVDRVRLDRAERADPPVVEEEGGGRLLWQIERALGVREQDPRELRVRGRRGDRRDRGIGRLGPALEPPEARAERAREHRDREVQ